jgi:hypothetical protein
MFEGLFQPVHLLVIFGIALLVFGPNTTSPNAKRSGSSVPKPMSHSGQLLSSTTLVLVLTGFW